MKVLLLIGLLAGFGAAVGFAQTRATTQPATTRSNDVTWSGEGNRISSQLSVQLSVERDELLNKDGANYMSPLNQRKVPRNEEAVDVNAFVKVLERWLPEATIIKDSKTPRRLHIVETSLNKIPNYVLNQKMTINFEGTFAALLEELQRLSDGRLVRLGQFSTPGRRADHDFAVKVNVANTECREIISAAIASNENLVATSRSTAPATTRRDFAPVKQSGISWTAFTIERDGKVLTYLCCE